MIAICGVMMYYIHIATGWRKVGFMLKHFIFCVTPEEVEKRFNCTLNDLLKLADSYRVVNNEFDTIYRVNIGNLVVGVMVGKV